MIRYANDAFGTLFQQYHRIYVIKYLRCFLVILHLN